MGKFKLNTVPVEQLKQKKLLVTKPRESAKSVSEETNGSTSLSDASKDNANKRPSEAKQNPLENIEALQSHLWDAADNLRS